MVQKPLYYYYFGWERNFTVWAGLPLFFADEWDQESPPWALKESGKTLSVRLDLSISTLTAASSWLSFKLYSKCFFMQQHYCLLLTQETIELVGVPPASPGELRAGWAREERRGLAIFRGGHLATIYIILVSVCTLLLIWSNIFLLVRSLRLSGFLLLFTVSCRRRDNENTLRYINCRNANWKLVQLYRSVLRAVFDVFRFVSSSVVHGVSFSFVLHERSQQ